MRGKGKKKIVRNNGKNGKKGKNSKNGKNNGSKNKGTKRSRRSGGRAKFTMDIFNEEVMENAYYTCHNIMDVLKCRGFPWPESQKKKKKKGKK
ncbi:PREDICTED: small lysine-rich protein 1 [Eufriesea mexicana]|uniref:small lysine-rich protein 1 n=1 Tax=Eufriesea mexicana TaxID=516756 RepID=UPI00083C1104|nr:PREDICTED: small lysine-rich protein 1 [Eufriesea mexicana]